MTGKEKCEFLKGIRKRMAEANGIPYETRECTYEGDCLGTCPICEQEARELLAQIRLKEANGAPIQVDEDAIAMLEYFQKYGLLTPAAIKRMQLEKRRILEPLMGDICLQPDEDMKREWKQREEDEKRSRHDDFVSQFFGDTHLSGEVNPHDEEWDELLEILRMSEEKELDESSKDDDSPFSINPFKGSAAERRDVE